MSQDELEMNAAIIVITVMLDAVVLVDLVKHARTDS